MLYVYSDLHADVLKHPITVYYFKEGWVALNFVYDIGSRWRIVETQEEGIKGTYDGIWYKSGLPYTENQLPRAKGQQPIGEFNEGEWSI